MSAEYKGQDPIKLAQQAEKDLNSSAAKTGHGGSDSSMSLLASDTLLSQSQSTPIPQLNHYRLDPSLPTHPDPFTEEWSFEEALTF